MTANRLPVNPEKYRNHLVLFSSASASHPTGHVRINNYGYHTGPLRQRPDFTMRTHVIATVRSCFAALGQIRSKQRFAPRHALLTLILALVISKVDYCNSVLTSISGHLMDKF